MKATEKFLGEEQDCFNYLIYIILITFKALHK